MRQMIKKCFSISTILGVWGVFLLCAQPLEAVRRTGVHKDPAVLGDYYRTVGRHAARMSQKFTDLSQECLPQKPFIAKRPRASLSSAVTSPEWVSRRSGRVQAGRTPGLLPVILLFMSLASTAEGADCFCPNEPPCYSNLSTRVLHGFAFPKRHVPDIPPCEWQHDKSQTNTKSPTTEENSFTSSSSPVSSSSSTRATSASAALSSSSSPSSTHRPSRTRTSTGSSSRLGSRTLSSADLCAAASPTVGITCADGSFYAGKHPVTNAKLYVMVQDAPSTLNWNDGSSNWVDLPTPMDNCGGTVGAAGCYNGTAYTAYLASLTTPSPAPYKAAQYCANLAPPDALALGHDDWYLPSKDELNVVYVGLGPQPAHNFQNAGYWSSSENGANYAWLQGFAASGGQSYYYKNNLNPVRCIRQ